MHMRRALLLFAIVLGLAALAASLSRPRSDRSGEDPVAPTAPAATTPTAAPQKPASEPRATLTFDASADETLRVEAGRSAALAVEVEEAGQVVIPSLGLDEPAQPLTPALFDLLLSKPGRHEIEFTPSAGDETRGAGTLVVE